MYSWEQIDKEAEHGFKGIPAPGSASKTNQGQSFQTSTNQSSWGTAPAIQTQKPEALLNASSKPRPTKRPSPRLLLRLRHHRRSRRKAQPPLDRLRLGRFAIHTTRKRLLGIPRREAIRVQNLGKYERQAWQAAEFPANGKNKLEEQKEREQNYRKFILEFYHATPVGGHVWLHGVKAGRMVHVGAVDAPVTRADVNAIAAEVWKAAGKGANSPQKPAVDILGWEFALEMNETAREVAAAARVDAAFKKIPESC